MRFLGLTQSVTQWLRLAIANTGEISVETNDSSGLDYTVANVNNWPVPAPTTVASALNVLALPGLGSYYNSGALGPAATILLDSPSTQIVKSGSFMMFGMVTTTATSAGIITYRLRVDGTVIGYTQRQTCVAGGVNVFTGFSTYGVDPTAGHTIGIQATVSAGTLSAVANEFLVGYLETGG